ncbi:MAG: M28 family peptidase [Dehalococcoidia bacterium]
MTRTIVAACAALLLACSGGAPASTAVTATPASGAASEATSSPTPSAPARATATEARSGATAAAPPPGATVPLTGPVDVDRALAHLRTLAVEIGVRDSGSENERRAARYIADVLTAQGYTTNLETFTYSARYDESSVKPNPSTTVRALLLDGAANGSVSGVLVDGGTGLPEQIAAVPARGAIVLMRRGGLPFAQKVANAQDAGAVGAIIVNVEGGLFAGRLGDYRSDIPAVAVAGRQWDALRSVLGQTVEVTGSTGSRTVTSQNVVGRRGETCRAYLGAHYDSVPEGPGANDNASGTAALLEIARVRGTNGLCVLAFGSEETGLHGSQAYVASAQALDQAKFMVNFDMMARIDDAIIVGDAALTERILDIIGRGPEQPLKAGSFPPFASSDHVSFSRRVPAVTVTSGDDPNIHTAGDNFEAIRPDDLRTMLRLGDAAVAGLLQGLAGN